MTKIPNFMTLYLGKGETIQIIFATQIYENVPRITLLSHYNYPTWPYRITEYFWADAKYQAQKYLF